MKKLMKKIAVPVLSLAMLLGTTAVPAFAAVNGIQTYGMLCPECNRGEVVLVNSHKTTPISLYDYPCAKDPSKKDQRMQYTQYNTWKCTYCTFGDANYQTHEYDECGH